MMPLTWESIVRLYTLDCQKWYIFMQQMVNNWRSLEIFKLHRHGQRERCFDAMNCMNSNKVHEQKYSPEMIVRGLKSLYQQLHIDYELSSIKTLTRLTSKVSNMEDKSLKKNNNCVNQDFLVATSPWKTENNIVIWGNNGTKSTNFAFSRPIQQQWLPFLVSVILSYCPKPPIHCFDKSPPYFRNISSEMCPVIT